MRGAVTAQLAVRGCGPALTVSLLWGQELEASSGSSECGWREDTGVTVHTEEQRKESGMWDDRGMELEEITTDSG